MSREIKFAFWHKRKKEMWHVESIDWRTKEVSNGGDVASLDDGDLLQFTGLLDKNGKEIFEGGILSHKYYSKPVMCEFVDGSLIFDDISKYDKSLEVIGNIYQNPELLGGENE
jgi:uncharacterized phage protein (TIGR01671 family)